MWIDTHCHLDAAAFAQDRDAVRARARALGVHKCLIPAVARGNFEIVRELAYRYDDWYALGIHPLYVGQATQGHLDELANALIQHRQDGRLVAVGEIGLDYFSVALLTEADKNRQWYFFIEQLKLAKRLALPVVLHLRKSADHVLKGLRQIGNPAGGIAHAFNGSLAQAQSFIGLGFKLGFGGTLSYARALHIKALALALPITSIVLETDAPDMAPHWLHLHGKQKPPPRNSPEELPALGIILSQLRGLFPSDLARQTAQNSRSVLIDTVA